VSRIDGEAPADCSIILVRLQRSCDRLLSSLCVAPRTSIWKIIGHFWDILFWALLLKANLQQYRTYTTSIYK